MPKEINIPKIYSPLDVEKKWYKHWIQKKYFDAKVDKNKKPYTIVIPPPNITGSLTIGHVLNNTIQDVLIRRSRMMGKSTCWIPGTDHASIATETKVTKMLLKKGIVKKNISREKFIEYSWEWKKQYGSLITEQLKRLGCSCDWKRESFTLNEKYSKAVLHAFVDLYNKGLIYRGNRLVNWCTASQSAISDEEVYFKEINGNLWYVKYPILNSNEKLIVATTRPETILGDTAIAMNPNDKRFLNFKNKYAIEPFTQRKIPIIADNYVDKNFGTGLVKITPAHDPNDFEISKRHNLEIINILNPDGTLNNNVPKSFVGLNIESARKKIVDELNELDLIYKIEPYKTNIGFSERGNVPVQPYLSKQWFISMKKLASPAINVVKDKHINFYPKHWVKTYEHWMVNIQDWCISRQLWWGHRIPVWYSKKDNNKLHVSLTPPNDKDNWVQDEDVLDTWASSWLWPMAVHDWPEDSEDLEYFHPTDDLVTGPDIIFFWVARMIMASLEFKKEIPFKNVYFTGMVRDMDGRKMSKSLGNSPDPIKLIDDYGADAIRFGIMLVAPQGQDILFSEERIKQGRNFMNKIWNVARFLSFYSNDISILSEDELKNKNLDLSDKWIINKLDLTIESINSNFKNYKFNEIAKCIYEFVWFDYCDWYIEIIKSRLQSDDVEEKIIAFSNALTIFNKVLKLMHPFSPFITEELWNRFKLKNNDLDIVISDWPQISQFNFDKKINNQFEDLKNLITKLRNLRFEMNIPSSQKSDLLIKSKKSLLIYDNRQLIMDLGNVKKIEFNENIKRPKQSAMIIYNLVEIYIPLDKIVNVEQEKIRIQNKIDGLKSRLEVINLKINNKNFISKAPKQIIKKELNKVKDIKENLIKLNQNIDYLK